MTKDGADKTIGRYQVSALVGRGGMAVVYRAVDPTLNRVVAIKVMHAHLASDPEFVGRFQHEAQAVAALRHPSIVKVFDFGNEADSYYMVMEFIEGSTLAALLEARASAADTQAGAVPQIPPGLAAQHILRIFGPLCSAIDYAAARGMVHRDIKPANILLTEEGEPVLTDYGIARILGATSYTAAGMVMGSAHYMSPEQVQGFPVDHRTDIYSLGIVLFQALAGRVPFDADTTSSILAQHMAAPVPLVHSMNPGLPAEVQGVLERALAKDPKQRYQSAGSLAAALEAALASVAPVAPAPLPGPVPDMAATVVSGMPPHAGEPGAEMAGAEPLLAQQEEAVSGGAYAHAPTRVEKAMPEVAGDAGVPAELYGGRRLRSRLLRPWLIAAAALIVVIAVVATVLLTRSGEESSGSASTSVSTSVSTSSASTVTTSTTLPAVVDVKPIVDEGDALMEDGYLEGAIARYQEALREDPDSDLALTSLGVAYYLHGEYAASEALPELELATQKNPANARAWTFLSFARTSTALRERSGDFESAEEAGLKALDLDADSGVAHASLARALAASGQQEEALVEMQTAFDLDPQDPWVSVSGGWIHAVAKDWEAAVPHYRSAVNLQPNWAEFHALLAEALRWTGEYDEAAGHYQTMIDLDQGWKVYGYTYLGLTLAQKGDTAAAITNLEEAITLDDTYHESHFVLGAIWLQQQDYETALPYLQQAVELMPADAPDNSLYEERLGFCLIELGRYEEAREAIDEALVFDPNNENAQELSEVLAAEGY